MPYSHIYSDALKDIKSLEEFWEKDRYEQVTWETGNALICKYLAEPGIVIDLGCGIYPHDNVPHPSSLIGVDISYESLLVAKKNYPKLGLGYVCADSLRLPLKSSSVQHIIAVGELWNHLAHERFLAEMFRVLKLGGIAVFDVSMKLCLYNIYLFVGSILGMSYAKDIDKREAWAAIKRPFDSAKMTWRITPEYKAKVLLPTSSEVLVAIRRSGFEIVDIFGTVVISDIIPPPLQNLEVRSKSLSSVMQFLRKLDAYLGGTFPLWRLGGNCFFVVRKSQS